MRIREIRKVNTLISLKKVWLRGAATIFTCGQMADNCMSAVHLTSSKRLLKEATFFQLYSEQQRRKQT